MKMLTWTNETINEILPWLRADDKHIKQENKRSKQILFFILFLINLLTI